jgi:hypothetical protein
MIVFGDLLRALAALRFSDRSVRLDSWCTLDFPFFRTCLKLSIFPIFLHLSQTQPASQRRVRIFFCGSDWGWV